MKFVYLNWFPLVFLFFIILTFLLKRIEKNFFNFVKRHWFYKKSFSQKCAFFFQTIGTLCLCLSLLNLRGPLKSVKQKTTRTQTMILIDTSLSMGAQDIRPSRFEKALMLARHFVKFSCAL